MGIIIAKSSLGKGLSFAVSFEEILFIANNISFLYSEKWRNISECHSEIWRKIWNAIPKYGVIFGIEK